MKATTLLAGSVAALLATSSANADVCVHIAGSTAFRKATVNAVIALMGGTGNFKAHFKGTSGNIQGANQSILQGSIAGVPGTVTVKCDWTGSVGGVKTIVQDLDLTGGWLGVACLPATNVIENDTNTASVFSNSDFPGETAKTDVSMSDSAQASTGFTTVSLSEHQVGVIPFEFVAGSGTPAGLSNLTPLLAQAVISGGVPISQFTKTPTDTGLVYFLGRDFDSGTRLSCLAETGVGVFGSVVHIQPIVEGTVATSGGHIRGLKKWDAAVLLGQNFSIGQSGFASGGTLADNLATQDAATAGTRTYDLNDGNGVQTIPSNQRILGNSATNTTPRYLIGYLGRDDAARAVKHPAATNPGNNAHRMTFNGYAIAPGAFDGETGIPTGGYDDALIKEGLYQCWEYEYLDYRSTLTGDPKSVADAIVTQIQTTQASDSGIKLGDMNVSKAVEGGIITHL